MSLLRDAWPDFFSKAEPTSLVLTTTHLRFMIGMITLVNG